MTLKHKHSIFACACFVLLTVLLFWQFFFKGHIPFSGPYMLSWYEPWRSIYTVHGVPTLIHKPVVDDTFRLLYPLHVVASNLMKQGQLPLWNPYNAAGTPLLSIMHPGFLTPFGIFFLFLPPTLGWSFYIMLQPLVLGVATYWYVTKLRLSPRAALFSSLVLLLSGFAIVRMEYGEFLYVLAGLPILLGIVEVWKNTPNHRSVVGIPFVVAVMMVSGQPGMIMYTLLVFALYASVRLPLKGVIILGSLAFLGVGLAGIQLIPGLELYQLSTINREASTFIFDRFLLPLSHLVTVIIPNYFGNQATYNYFGPHDYTETIAYIGSIPVFLAALAWWKRRHDQVVLFFGLLTVGATATAIRWVGAQLFFTLPIPVLSSDVPSRVFVLTTFGVSILSGYGVSVLERLKQKEARRIFGVAAAVMGIILVVTVLRYFARVPCPTVQTPQCRLVSVRTSLLEAGVFFACIIEMFIFRRIKGPMSKILVWAPCAIVVAIGLYNGLKFLPFSAPEMVYPPAPVISALQKVSGLDRYAAIGRATIRTNLTTMFGLYSTEYFDPLHVRRYAQLVSFVNTGSATQGVTRSDVLFAPEASPSAEVAIRRERFFDITSTRYLVTRKDELATVEMASTVWEDELWRVSTRPTSLPRMYIVYDAEVAADDMDLLKRLFDPGMDIHNTVLLEREVPVGLAGNLNQLPVSIERHTSALVQATVASPERGILVLTDTWYPGWKAFVDGKEMPIFRANYTFRAIVVPKGTHTILFSYEPLSLRIGAGISIASFVLIVLYGLGVFYGKIQFDKRQ